ncbi:hypothetical protein, partial [Escherichia coli]|uniref:hypothetical protein n=1 Tax=Escherichia coli TaxID=562 RepID=UPI001ABD40BC
RFLELSRLAHGEVYEYDGNSYKGITHKIRITCKDHGVFWQLCTDHIKGHGCKKCGMNLNGFARSNFVDICEKRNNGEGFLYLIECFSGAEKFYKVGITSQQVSVRFAGKHMPYQYQVLEVLKGESSVIYDLETKIHRLLKLYR